MVPPRRAGAQRADPLFSSLLNSADPLVVIDQPAPSLPGHGFCLTGPRRASFPPGRGVYSHQTVEMMGGPGWRLNKPHHRHGIGFMAPSARPGDLRPAVTRLGLGSAVLLHIRARCQPGWLCPSLSGSAAARMLSAHAGSFLLCFP